MFTLDDAQSLRDALGPINFSAATQKSELIEKYLATYQLQLDLPSHDYSIGLIESGGFELVGQYFQLSVEQCKGCIFVLHGYYDHLGLYRHLIKHCLEQGYSVFGFDLPGHGLSAGKAAAIESFSEYVAALRDCCGAVSDAIPQPWNVIGQSTGSAIVMDYLLGADADQTPFTQHILFCPLLYSANWRWSRILFYLVRTFTQSSKRTFARNSHDENFLRFIRRQDQLQSRRLQVSWVNAMIDYHHRFKNAQSSDMELQIIQGTGDTTVDWRKNLPLIQEKFPRSATYTIADARHHLVNESEEYRSLVFSRVTSILGGTNEKK